MIDPNTLTTLSSFGPKALAVLLDNSGYQGASFEDAVFLGVNPDGLFVYEVQYYDDAGTGETQGYVFIGYDHERGAITAEY